MMFSSALNYYPVNLHFIDTHLLDYGDSKDQYSTERDGVSQPGGKLSVSK